MTEDVLPPDADNENTAPTFCYFCDRRAVLVPGGGPHAFCVRCIRESAKRNPLVFPELPSDPYLRECVYRLLGAL
jgi:hypothetical protein